MIARTRRGYDAGKKINGTKRHLAVDAARAAPDGPGHRRLGAGPRRGQATAVEPAESLSLHQARLGRRRLRWQAGHLGRTRLKPKLTLEIVKRPDDLHTFKVLPRRWVVERNLSWITRHRRTVRDYERQAARRRTSSTGP